MKKMTLEIALLGLIALATMPSCKSDFDKIRSSGDVKMLTTRSLDYYAKGEWSKAQTLFELIMPSLKGQAQLEEISYKYGYTHFNLHNYQSANFYFKNFANTFSNSSFREDAEFQAAYSEYKQSPTFRLDQETSVKAIEGFQYFANNFPESKRVKECNKLIDELRSKMQKKAFDEGVLYYAIQEYQASITVFDNLLKEFPDIADVEQTRFLILKAQYSWAENSVYEKQAERYKVMVEKYKDFNDKFPTSKYKKDAELYLKNANAKLKNFAVK
jgi:outer membrane protein assembly factor BamD